MITNNTKTTFSNNNNNYVRRVKNYEYYNNSDALNNNDIINEYSVKHKSELCENEESINKTDNISDNICNKENDSCEVNRSDSDDGGDDNATVKCIFLCEFHATAGPKIAAQVPESFISKDLFDTVNRYIIPKLQLQRSFLSV